MKIENFLKYSLDKNIKIATNVEALVSVISFQLKLIKMRAKLANLNHCAVPV